MKSTEKSNLFADVDVDSIIKKSIASSVKSEVLNESYVAEPKQFKQVSEFVSQKVKNSHIDLYKGYVESMNRVSAELDSAERSEVDSKHSQFRSLKLDETYNSNSVWLHELYFANCFDPSSEIVMDSSSFIELQRVWGTFDDWQRDFIACAMAAGQGWAVCGYNVFLKQFINTCISNNSQDVMIGLYPVLVLDMNEHSYWKDYLSDKKSYIVAMLRQINWQVVEERVNKAKSIAQVVK